MFKMKSMLKRITAGALAAATVLGFAGCGKKEAAKYTDDESQPYEIVWYYIGNSGNKDLPEVEKEVNKYLKKKINATVKMNVFDYGTYQTKISNITSSGEKYDLRWINRASYQTEAYKGAFIDINELFSKYAPKTRELLGEDFLKGCMVDGKLYAVPANKDKAHYRSLFYRKDIADKYGLDLSDVRTWEEMYPFYDVIKEKEQGMYCYGIGGGTSPWDVLSGYEDVTGNNFIGFLPGSDKLQVLYESKEFEKYCKMAHDMYLKGYVHKDVAVEDNTSRLKSQGKIFCFAGQSKPGKLEELNAQGDFKYGEIKLTDSETTEIDALGSMMSIPVTCKNPVRVMKFIELLNTDKYLNNLINFGIEGKHYEKVSENRLTIKQESGYKNIGNQWVYGNIFENYVYDGEDDDKFKILKEFNESAKVSDKMGFLPNMEPVKIQASSCLNVCNDYIKSLTYGAVDVDETLPKFIKKLKSAGVEEVLAELQKQYDGWKK